MQQTRNFYLAAHSAVGHSIVSSIIHRRRSAFQEQSQFRLIAATQGQTNEDPQIALRGIQQPASERALVPAYNIINESLFKQSHYEKGEDFYQRTIAADIDALGPNHPSVANDLTGLAQLYISQQKYSEAKPLLGRALRVYDQVYGASNILTINTRALLAGVEFHLGNADRAAELYRSALSQGQSALGPNSLETARYSQRFGIPVLPSGETAGSKHILRMGIGKHAGKQ